VSAAGCHHGVRTPGASFVGASLLEPLSEAEAAHDELLRADIGRADSVARRGLPDGLAANLTEDVVYFNGEVSRPACLYCGTPDDAGEYPVLQLSWDNGVARIGGFVPFDVWVAQELGALERGKEIGDVPPEYAALVKALADSNGDGRIAFTPKAGEATSRSSEDDDDDDDDDSATATATDENVN
jgi:hypothetical protein